MKCLLLLSTMLLPVAAIAQPARAPVQVQVPSQAQPADARAVVAEVRRILAERYVLPERRPALDAALAQGLSNGRYDTSDPGVLVERINADLTRVANDRHLSISYDPRRSAMMAAGAPGGRPDPAVFERQVRARNHGIFELKLLPGNIRYMDYRGFDWTGPDSAAALDQALTFLSGGDAVIIDLRRNGGGSPQAVQHLVSHFMEAGRPLITFYMNGEASPDRLETLPQTAVPRMVGKPLYVLTSGASASAAEEFVGHVGGYRLGELVGERTAGAGFRNTIVPISGGFFLSVSVGRAVLASTGRDWEATGLEPTIAVPVETALDVAQAHALRHLAANAEGPRRAELEGLAQGLDAVARPGTPGAAVAAYAGNYGSRTIALEDGKLFYRLEARPRRQLVSLGGHDFTFADDPGQRVRFRVADGRATAFDVGPAAGPAQGTYARTQ